MMVGTGGDVQWGVPGRDIVCGGQDARIHTCREPSKYHRAWATPGDGCGWPRHRMPAYREDERREING